MTAELSTVADDLVVVHNGAEVHRFDGLDPATDYNLAGIEVRTLSRPDGKLLCRFATVNDVHFGETECGVIGGFDGGPILRVGPGEDPYPETMNNAAAAEIAAIEPAVVVAKGDLTADGQVDQYEAFLKCYSGAFGERLMHVRGNHDAYHGQHYAAGNQLRDLPGVRVALLDTVRPTQTTGALTVHTVDWLDDVAANADRPVLVFGHHHPWSPESPTRNPDYFGLDPDSSDRLVAVIGRRKSILGYFAGHTHRNRTRRFAPTGAVPYVEVGCVKDFPGSWAEYRVFEGGILHIHHRISTPEALAWSQRCRVLYSDLGIDYTRYALGDRLEDRCLAISLR